MDVDVYSHIKGAFEFSYDLITKERRCAVCSQVYREDHNMGAWKCWQHGGSVVGQRWSCCNLLVARGVRSEDSFYSTLPPKNQQGCVRCDHKPTIAQFTVYDCVIMPHKKLRSFSGIVKQAVELKMSEPPSIIIWRYDHKMHEDLMQVVAAYANTEKKYVICQNPSLLSALLEESAGA